MSALPPLVEVSTAGVQQPKYNFKQSLEQRNFTFGAQKFKFVAGYREKHIYHERPDLEQYEKEVSEKMHKPFYNL